MAKVVFSSWTDEIIDNRGKSESEFQNPENLNIPDQFDGDEVKVFVGWNGIVLKDEGVSIIEACWKYMEEAQKHSCGKCFLCRIGTKVLADIFRKLVEGEATESEVEIIKKLSISIKEGSRCNLGQTVTKPILDALEYFEEDFKNAVSGIVKKTELNYISKLTAPCMDACPIHLPIPQYVEAIREGRFQDSLDLIRTRLPLPGIVGRVCVKPCEDNCRRMLLDGPIAIKHLKRFVADVELNRKGIAKFTYVEEPKDKKVAIIGAGPAGLTAAYHLGLKGYKVKIFERLGEPGGMAAVGIPDYRLPRDIIRKETEAIQSLGVEIAYNTYVGKDIKLSELENEFDAIIIGIGAHSSSRMRVEGEDAGYKGFIPGVQYLLDINNGKDPYPEGKRVVVVGGGNVAMDCVRCSLRLGKEEVILVYRRTRNEMPANVEEIEEAEEEGVKFMYLTNPTKIVGKDGKVVGIELIKMQLGEPDESGRRRPVPIEGSEFFLECDIVVPAIGQAIDLSVLEGVEGVEVTRKNTIVIDTESCMTSRKGIFAAGDVVTSPDALIRACAGGRRAADRVDKYLKGEEIVPSLDEKLEDLMTKVKVFDPAEDIGIIDGRPRVPIKHMSPEERKNSFIEYTAGYTIPEARAEADRCLKCYRVWMIGF